MSVGDITIVVTVEGGTAKTATVPSAYTGKCACVDEQEQGGCRQS